MSNGTHIIEAHEIRGSFIGYLKLALDGGASLEVKATDATPLSFAEAWIILRESRQYAPIFPRYKLLIVDKPA